MSRRAQASAVRRLKSATSRVEAQPYDYAPAVRTPRLGAASASDYWCRLSGSLGPATGTWPAITATSTTADVYHGSGASIVKVATAAAIYNRRNVTWAASKTTYVVPAGGGGYAIVDQDC